MPQRHSRGHLRRGRHHSCSWSGARRWEVSLSSEARFARRALGGWMGIWCYISHFSQCLKLCPSGILMLKEPTRAYKSGTVVIALR